MSHRAPRRIWPWVLFFAALLVAVLVGTYYYVGLPTRATPRPTAATASPAHRLPQACADAMALGRDLARHAEPLGAASVDHVVIMERLEKGQITGEEAYELGESQVKVMEEHGAEVQIRARRFTKLAARCPIQ